MLSVRPGRYMQTCLCILMMVCIPTLSSAAQPTQQSLSYRISRGMEVTILKNPAIPYIHAQLVIHYFDKVDNPAVPYLTIQNLFDTHIKESDTPLLNALRKLGNDFQVEIRPDFLLLKINFLPDKTPTFIRFLKHLFNYKPFTDLDIKLPTYPQRREHDATYARFKDSTDNYWKHFFKLEDWKKKMAFQLAYHYLFPDSILGRTLITPKMLAGVTLEDLIAFHIATFKLRNSQLILKGNLDNPPVFYGSLERAFSSRSKPPPIQRPQAKITLTNKKKVYIVNTRNGESPSVFWFQPVETGGRKDPLPAMAINHLLFGYPTGRLFLTASRYLNVSGLRIRTEMVFHNGVAVICNTVRLRYVDIEKFILLAEREKNKLNLKGINRKELLDTISYLFGRLKVETRNVGDEVGKVIANMPVSPPQITPAGLTGSKQNHYQPVIIIVGNAEHIKANLSTLKDEADVINFFQ